MQGIMQNEIVILLTIVVWLYILAFERETNKCPKIYTLFNLIHIIYMIIYTLQIIENECATLDYIPELS